MTDKLQSLNNRVYWRSAKRPPKDEMQWLKLRCSDGNNRYGYGTRWPDGSFAGWMIDALEDFVKSVSFDYEVTGWMPADIPEPIMGLPE